MKKISELATQSFLGGTNVPANSYVLINYADSANSGPVTKKVSVEELGKAIANNLQLYKKTNNGAVTTSVSNNAYVNSTAENLVSDSEKEMLTKLNYYMTADSVPYLTLQGPNPLDAPVQILTNAVYQDSNFVSGFPVVYDNTASQLKYINSSNVLTQVPLASGENTPFVVDVNNSQHSYVLYNENTGLTIVDSTDNSSNLGQPVFYTEDNGELEFVDAEGTPLTLPTGPIDDTYNMNLSEVAYQVLGINNKNVLGVYQNLQMGFPLVYNAGERSIGFYGPEGSFITVNVSVPAMAPSAWPSDN